MRKNLLLTLGLLAGGLIHAQTPHTLLWKISGKGLTRPSWLFGTMHILCAEDITLSDNLKKAIVACDQIYFEIKIDDMADMLSGFKYMQMNDGVRLSDLLDSANYARVKTYFTTQQSLLPFPMLERLKPLLISSLIEEQNLSCNSTNGMELMILAQSKPLNKPIRGLETMEFQAGLFDSIPYKKQAVDLVNYIDSMKEYKQMDLDLASIYKSQDLDKIDSMSRREDPSTSEYMNLLLYDRNRKWARILNTLLHEHSLLVAVGAAHLPGDDGVINLLRKEGYTLTPVRNN